MARFDSGGAAGSAETVARRLLVLLSFPLMTLLEQLPVLRFPGLLGYVPFAANAPLWGVAVVVGRRRWQGRTLRPGG